ncbi:MAG: hypothetical protein WA220_08875 [Candidatus Nitrosopolaris sp.]
MSNLTQRRSEAFDKCLDWICENIYELDALDCHFGLKVLSEMNLLCSLYKRKLNNIYDDRINKIIFFTTEQLRRVGYLDGLARMPESLSFYAFIYKSLYECGLKLQEFRNAIVAAVDQEAVNSRERIPFGMMDLCYALNKANIRHPFPTLRSLYHKTLLAKDPAILSLNLNDAYDITHIIFYLSDFGFRKFTEISAQQLPKVRWIITVLTGLYLRDQDWDILAELLSCYYCLRWYPYPIYEVAWNNLLNAQRVDGSIPGSGLRNEKLEMKSKSWNKNFTRNYHATIVTAIACLLTSDRDPTYCHRNIHYLPAKSKISLSEARLVCKRAHLWLGELYKNLDQAEYDFSSLLYILLGEWIYFGAFETRSLSNLYALAEEIRKKIDAQSANKRMLTYPVASLALLSTAILRALKISSKTLEDFTKVAHEALRTHIPKTEEEEKINLFQSRFLIHKICLTPKPECKNLQMSYTPDELNRLYVSKDNWDYLSKYVAATSLFGTKKIRFDRNLKVHIHSSLVFYLFHSLNSYNLKMGFQLLQTMCYLHLNKGRSFKQALEFITQQQRPDGSFGFFGPEALKLEKSDPKINVKFDLYLPITVYAMWTIAEAFTTQYSVFLSI